MSSHKLLAASWRLLFICVTLRIVRLLSSGEINDESLFYDLRMYTLQKRRRIFKFFIRRVLKLEYKDTLSGAHRQPLQLVCVSYSVSIST
jgi:hypothetical protein